MKSRWNKKEIKEFIKKNKKKLIGAGIIGFLIIVVVWPFIFPIRVTWSSLPYEYTIHGTYIEINRYTENEEEVVVPEKICFRPVKVLGTYMEYGDWGEAGAFDKKGSVKKVYLPDSIEEISTGCFSNCNHLEEIRLSESLREIPYHAFWACESLQSVEIPEGVEVIGGSAFAVCQNLEYVQLPESLKSIRLSAFIRCEALEKVEIPAGVEEIEGDSFWGTGWEESFQEDFVIVGKNVLIYYGGNEREVKVPEEVEYIGSLVFYNAEEMESLELPASLKKCGLGMVSSIESKNLKYVTVRNPSMEFGEDVSRDIFYEYDSELILIGEKGSTAEAYAEKKGYGFVELQPEE